MENFQQFSQDLGLTSALSMAEHLTDEQISGFQDHRCACSVCLHALVLQNRLFVQQYLVFVQQHLLFLHLQHKYKKGF